MVAVSLAHIKKSEPAPAPAGAAAPARPFAPVPGKGLSKLVTNKDAALAKFLARKQGTLEPQQMELVNMAQRKIAETPAERLSGAAVWKKVQREDGAAMAAEQPKRRKQKGGRGKQKGRGGGRGGGGAGRGGGGAVAARLVIDKKQRQAAGKQQKKKAHPLFNQALQQATGPPGAAGARSKPGKKPSVLSRLGTKAGSEPEAEEGKPVAGCPDWVQYRDDEGTPYYYNLETEATQWELPKPAGGGGARAKGKPAVLSRLGRVYK
jgi:hypothetical protein